MTSLDADVVCQWCKKVVAVNTAPGMWLVVAENAEVDGKYYCINGGGKCFQDLVAMSKYVTENFKL